MPEAMVSSASMRIVKLLVGNPPLTVAQLIDATKVTRTAVTEQLNELVAAGFAERTIERLPGRGRPRHLYKSTSAALLLLFASNQHLVVPAIWQAIDDVGGKELSRKILQRVARTLAEHYRRRISARSPAERLRQMTKIMVEEGHLVQVGQGKEGQLILRKRSCPFISMFENKRTVCGVDIDVISAVVEAPVRQVGCRHDGDPCCSFELATNGKPHP
jgi:DeoR family transcriptional regulator, suf operon transcriptional repressor